MIKVAGEDQKFKVHRTCADILNRFGGGLDSSPNGTVRASADDIQVVQLMRTDVVDMVAYRLLRARIRTKTRQALGHRPLYLSCLSPRCSADVLRRTSSLRDITTLLWAIQRGVNERSRHRAWQTHKLAATCSFVHESHPRSSNKVAPLFSVVREFYS